MYPQLTFELRVKALGTDAEAIKTKSQLLDWLLLNGVESFVEGNIDVDINQNQEEPPRDYYSELGGDLSPISVYRYSRESLDELKIKLGHAFGKKIESSLFTLKTETWMEGWKENFKPFSTGTFFVYPPWYQQPIPTGLIPLAVEPGMAFGTGQHATTRLCLEQLGRISRLLDDHTRSTQSVLDVGTGTGILAIGAKKLGYSSILGTDIEDDAILASKTNAQLNGVDVEFWLGSLPQKPESVHLVFANILAVVLLKMMPDLAAKTIPGGHLILSGLLIEEEAEIIDKAKSCGFKLNATQHLLGWSCVVLERI